MRLKVLGPVKVLLDSEVSRVSARGAEGAFTLLPRHVDYVAPLQEGPLAYEDATGHAGSIDIREGILVKCGDDVLVSLSGTEAGGSHEAQAREAVRYLEAGFTERYLRTTGED